MQDKIEPVIVDTSAHRDPAVVQKMTEATGLEVVTAGGKSTTESARDIILEHGNDDLKAFLAEFEKRHMTQPNFRLPHAGKHNIARAERAKARISHRKNKRKKR